MQGHLKTVGRDVAACLVREDLAETMLVRSHHLALRYEMGSRVRNWRGCWVLQQTQQKMNLKWKVREVEHFGLSRQSSTAGEGRACRTCSRELHHIFDTFRFYSSIDWLSFEAGSHVARASLEFIYEVEADPKLLFDPPASTSHLCSARC